MYEFTISTINHDEICEQIYIDLSKVLDRTKSIVATHKVGNICYVSFAVEKENLLWAKGVVADIVADTIASKFKFEFLSKNIINFGNNLQYDKLVCALVAFEIGEDKQIVKNELDIDAKINIDSFFQFRLKFLQERWKSIASIVNSNMTSLLADDIVDDLIRQFVKSTTCAVDLVEVFVDDRTICVQSSDSTCKMIFQKEEVDENMLVCEIISMSPNKIVIHSKNSGDEIENMLYSVFGNKIYKTR